MEERLEIRGGDKRVSAYAHAGGHTIDAERVLDLVRQIASLLDDPKRADRLKQMIREAQ